MAEKILTTAEIFCINFAVRNNLPVPRFVRRDKVVRGHLPSEEADWQDRSRYTLVGGWDLKGLTGYKLVLDYVEDITWEGSWDAPWYWTDRSVEFVKLTIHGPYAHHHEHPRDFGLEELPLPATFKPSCVNDCPYCNTGDYANENLTPLVVKVGMTACPYCGRKFHDAFLFFDYEVGRHFVHLFKDAGEQRWNCSRIPVEGRHYPPKSPEEALKGIFRLAQEREGEISLLLLGDQEQEFVVLKDIQFRLNSSQPESVMVVMPDHVVKITLKKFLKGFDMLEFASLDSDDASLAHLR